MKKFKRLIAIITVMLFALSIIVPAFAQDEAVAEETGSVYEQAAKVLQEKGILKGDESGNLMLDKALTRAEILAMIIRAQGQEDIVNDYKDVEPSFTDVPKDHWAFAYVEAGKDLGIVNGYPDGTFKPDKPVKFEELCKMLVAAKGESPAAGKWPLNYVRKALDLGFFNGIEDEVGIGDVVIRGQAAVAFQNAFFQPEKTIVVKDVKAVANDTIEVYVDVYLGNEVATLEDGDVMPIDFELKLASDETKTIAVTLVDSQASDFAAGKLVLKTQPQTPNAEYKVYFKGNDTGKKFVGAPANLQVAKVATDNLKTITVTFNDELDASTVVKDNFAVGSKTIADVKLLSDNKNVVIVLADGSTLSQFEKVTVTVKNLKSKYGKTLASYSTDITAQDTKQPDVSKVEAINPKMIKITFTEPINLAKDTVWTVRDWIKVDGASPTAKITDVNHVDKTITLELYSTLAKGTHNVEISNLYDYANFKIATKTLTCEVKEDLAAPQLLNAVFVTKTKIRVTFDEPLNTTGSFTVNGGIGISSVSEVAGSNKTQFDLALSSPLPLGTRVLFVTYSGQSDMAGNTVSTAQTRAFEIPDDTTPPDVKSVTVDSANAITVVFTEPIKKDTGTIKILQGTDEKGSISVSSSLFTADDTIKISGNIGNFNLSNTNAGTFTLRLSGIKDDSIRENLMLDKDISINLNDTVRPTVAGRYVVTPDSSDSSKDKITIYFSEPMDVASITNIASYIVVSGSTETPLNADPNYVSITPASDAKSVTITYKNARNLTNEQIKVIGVKDANGNVINPAISVLSKYDANVALGVVTVEAYSTKEVKVTFTNNIVSVDPRLFKLIDTKGTSGTEDDLEFTFSSASIDSNTVVKFVPTTTLPTNPTTWILKVWDPTKITDIYGKNLAKQAGDTVGTVTDRIKPTFTISSPNAGQLVIEASETVNGVTYADISSAIVVVKAEDGSQVVLDFTSSTPNATLDTNDPTAFKKITVTGLTSNKTYYVTILAGKIKDVANNDAATVVNYSITIK